MDNKHLIALEKWTLWLAALVVGTSLLVLSRRAAFAASLGAGLMVLNAVALRRIGQRGFKGFRKPSGAIILFNIKMAILIALVFVAIRFLHVDPIAFVIGISIFPVAIVAVAIQHAIAAPESPSPNSEDPHTHG
jgi:hypothetical protein